MPFDINIDDKYLVDKVVVDIDDFYYEIIDNKVLSINIEVLIDNLEEKPLFVKVEPEKEVTLDDLLKEENEDIKSLFDNIDDTNETYSTYRVCILRENETVEMIMQKYSVTKDILELYNNLSELKIGDKIIIPSLTNEKI